MSEKMAHALFVMDSSNGLCQQNADVHGLNLVALHLLQVVGNSIGYHHLKFFLAI